MYFDVYDKFREFLACIPFYCLFFTLLGIYSQTYCSEGKAKVNCSYSFVSQHNYTTLDLIIKRNESEVFKGKALNIAKNTAEVPFRLKDSHSAVRSLNYTCLWINPNNGLVLYKKNVSISRESKLLSSFVFNMISIVFCLFHKMRCAFVLYFCFVNSDFHYTHLTSGLELQLGLA